MPEEIHKSKLELITNFLKVVLWPLIVIIVILIFWKPINSIIGNSESITFGNLTVKIKNEIPAPSPTVKEVLGKISSQGIHELLYLGNDTSEYNGYGGSAMEDYPVKEMVNLKLMRFVEPLKGDTTKQYYKVTKLGADTYDFYINLINALSKNIIHSDKVEE